MPEKALHTLEEWIEILKDQADFTRRYRHNLYEKVGLERKRNILDIGCGTGIVTQDIASLTEGKVTGIDIDGEKLGYAKKTVPEVTFMKADSVFLPFKDGTFDLVVFSVVLVYIKDQQKAVAEMARVTQEGGIVLAVMEPDYESGLHYPENEVDFLYRKYMKEMGLDLTTGRKLKSLFRKAGLRTEIGICDVTLDFVNKGHEEQLEDFSKRFWQTESFLSKIGWNESQIDKYKQEQMELIKEETAFSFTPVFFAVGKK